LINVIINNDISLNETLFIACISIISNILFLLRLSHPLYQLSQSAKLSACELSAFDLKYFINNMAHPII
ncbi:MAG: hypothetical protein KAJ15_12800, partial [Spirochaetes bacterium]|nr:hypothetical protein [Spirochaetota bacterium]